MEHNSKKVSTVHRRQFGAEGAVVASAPGTLNLMGSHTEPHEGGLMLLGMDVRAWVAVSRREDHSVHCYSSLYREPKKWGLTGLKMRTEDRWSNVIKGVLVRIRTLGARVPGLNVTIVSDIPPGVGLGSSQAVGLAFTIAVADLLGFPLDPDEAAQITFHAERRFLGKRVGFASFLGAAVAREEHALFIDCRELDWQHCRWNLRGCTVAVVDAGINGCTTEEDLREREEGCLHCIRSVSGGRGLSRDVGGLVAELEARLGSLPERARRSALHVAMENYRVHELRRLLLVGDTAGIGKLMLDSHESLRDLYEVSCPEVDWIVRHTREVDGVWGTRILSGAGGPSVVALLKASAVEQYQQELYGYERVFGLVPRLFTSTAAGGVAVQMEQEVM